VLVPNMSPEFLWDFWFTSYESFFERPENSVWTGKLAFFAATLSFAVYAMLSMFLHRNKGEIDLYQKR
jgi:hypothetical protein